MISSIHIEINDRKLKLIEELGVLHEQSGMQPAAARVLSLLLVSDTTELTFEEICATLNLSKSATSNALNFLLSTKRVEYITKPGERKRYFRFKILSIKEGVYKSLEGIAAYNVLLKEALSLRTKETVEFNASLGENTRFLDFIKEELPKLYSKWESLK